MVSFDEGIPDLKRQNHFTKGKKKDVEPLNSNLIGHLWPLASLKIGTDTSQDVLAGRWGKAN